MDECGALAIANVLGRLAQRSIARQVVGTVATEGAEARVAVEHPRDISRRRLHVDGHRDRVTVVFDEVEDGKLPGRGRVERFPELTLARAAFTDRDVGNLVAIELRFASLNLRHLSLIHISEPTRLLSISY